MAWQRTSRPAEAATWLCDFFTRVRCIYAFQILDGTDHKNGWEILAAIKNHIWTAAPSILQADREGFTNEDGYHILWQFSDEVEGDWWMGVLQDGAWQHFQMDLGNRIQRDAFRQGQIPIDAKRGKTPKAGRYPSAGVNKYTEMTYGG